MSIDRRAVICIIVRIVFILYKNIVLCRLTKEVKQIGKEPTLCTGFEITHSQGRAISVKSSAQRALSMWACKNISKCWPRARIRWIYAVNLLEAVEKNSENVMLCGRYTITVTQTTEATMHTCSSDFPGLSRPGRCLLITRCTQ